MFGSTDDAGDDRVWSEEEFQQEFLLSTRVSRLSWTITRQSPGRLELRSNLGDTAGFNLQVSTGRFGDSISRILYTSSSVSGISTSSDELMPIEARRIIARFLDLQRDVVELRILMDQLLDLKPVVIKLEKSSR